VTQNTPLAAIKKVVFPALLVSAFALSSSVARADISTFNFTYVDISTGGMMVDTTGQFGAQLISGNEYLITSISGTRNGVTITSLLPPGSDFDFSIDDLLFVPPGTPNGFLSNTFTSGFGFTTADGKAYNPYFDPGSGNTFEYLANSGSVPGTQISLLVTATPEPSYYLPIGAGVSALVLLRIRKFSYRFNRP
jgi:hypothetical protein